MSLFSRYLLLTAWIVGLGLMIYLKGLPEVPGPNPDALTDVTLQPILALSWGLLKYMLSSASFSVILVATVKAMRMVVNFMLRPEDTLRSAILAVRKEEQA